MSHTWQSKALLLALGSILSVCWCTLGQAMSDPDRGTWRQTLMPRDLDRDGSTDAFYDTVLDITWLREVNITNGIAGMQFDIAYHWADELRVGSVTGWRLPKFIDVGNDGCNFSNAGGTDCGYNVLTKQGATVYSELGHLYYVTLGNKGYCAPGDEACVTPQSGYGFTNSGDFVNFTDGVYWSGTSYIPDAQYAWAFDSNGWQGEIGKWGGWWGVAIHDGDASLVPEASTALQLLLGAAAIIVWSSTRMSLPRPDCTTPSGPGSETSKSLSVIRYSSRNLDGAPLCLLIERDLSVSPIS